MFDSLLTKVIFLFANLSLFAVSAIRGCWLGGWVGGCGGRGGNGEEDVVVRRPLSSVVVVVVVRRPSSVVHQISSLYLWKLYICMFTKVEVEHWNQMLMSKRFDHEKAFPDIHGRIPRDIHIYASKAIV